MHWKTTLTLLVVMFVGGTLAGLQAPYVPAVVTELVTSFISDVVAVIPFTTLVATATSLLEVVGEP